MADWHPASIFGQEIGYWQTLIASGLALLAAVGAIIATILSANRQVRAANKQISTAQWQIEVTLRLDRQRNLYETRAFLIALQAAAEAVIDNDKEARKMIPDPPPNRNTFELYRVRERVTCRLIPELRPACVRLGVDLTPLFVRLDEQLSGFAAAWIYGEMTNNPSVFQAGKPEGFHDGLRQIEDQAKLLREMAEQRLGECIKELRSIEGA